MTGPICRRALFGAPAGLLLLAAPAAGPAKAAELDGELLALIAQMEAAQAVLDEEDANLGDSTEDWSRLDLALDDFWETADRIQDIRARTPEGMQAKARALRMVYRATEVSEENRIAQHVLGLVRDMLGEGAP